MVNLKLYVWIVRGKQRIAIIRAMYKPLTPTEIRKQSKQYNEKISLNNTSDVLRGFVKQGIAICLNPEDKTGRLYKLTDNGEEIRKDLLQD